MSRKMPGLGAAKRLEAAHKRNEYASFPRLSEIEQAAFDRGFTAAKEEAKLILEERARIYAQSDPLVSAVLGGACKKIQKLKSEVPS